MTPLVWANFPLALLFVLAWAGVPLWMIFKRPDTAPDSSDAHAYLAATRPQSGRAIDQRCPPAAADHEMVGIVAALRARSSNQPRL